MKSALIILIICLSFSSCTPIIVKVSGLTNTKPFFKKLPTNNKEVYFIGMRHLAKEDFYKNAKILIDSFSNLKYDFYVEAITPIRNGKPYIDTTARKKLRKAMGIDISTAYKNMPILQGMIEKYKLVRQTGYDSLGASQYKIVDLSYVTLVNDFEEKYGVIDLDSCDLNTQLGDPFNCKFLSKEQVKVFDQDFIMGARNKHVAETIMNSPDKKIIVIFGLKHYKGIKKELKKMN